MKVPDSIQSRRPGGELQGCAGGGGSVTTGPPAGCTHNLLSAGCACMSFPSVVAMPIYKGGSVRPHADEDPLRAGSAPRRHTCTPPSVALAALRSTRSDCEPAPFHPLSQTIVEGARHQSKAPWGELQDCERASSSSWRGRNATSARPLLQVAVRAGLYF